MTKRGDVAIMLEEDMMAEEERTSEGGGAGAGTGGGSGGGAGSNAGGDDVAEVYAEVERLREENVALAEQNRELVEGMSEESELRTELAQEKAEREALGKQVHAGNIERARQEILAAQPGLKDHLDLIGEDDPEEMRKRAAKLKEFAEAGVAASRAALEKEMAEKFGVPLGSSAEGGTAPEEVEARKKAVDSGDATAVAGQIVEKELDKLM